MSVKMRSLLFLFFMSPALQALEFADLFQSKKISYMLFSGINSLGSPVHIFPVNRPYVNLFRPEVRNEDLGESTVSATLFKDTIQQAQLNNSFKALMMGVGLGCSTILHNFNQLSEADKKKVAMIVLESPIADIENTIKNMAKDGACATFLSSLLYSTSSSVGITDWVIRRIGYSKFKRNKPTPLQRLKSIDADTTLIFIHNAHNETTPASDAMSLYKEAISLGRTAYLFIVSSSYGGEYRTLESILNNDQKELTIGAIQQILKNNDLPYSKASLKAGLKQQNNTTTELDLSAYQPSIEHVDKMLKTKNYRQF